VVGKGEGGEVVFGEAILQAAGIGYEFVFGGR